jgi:hypothetical protein
VPAECARPIPSAPRKFCWHACIHHVAYTITALLNDSRSRPALPSLHLSSVHYRHVASPAIAPTHTASIFDISAGSRFASLDPLFGACDSELNSPRPLAALLCSAPVSRPTFCAPPLPPLDPILFSHSHCGENVHYSCILIARFRSPGRTPRCTSVAVIEYTGSHSETRAVGATASWRARHLAFFGRLDDDGKLNDVSSKLTYGEKVVGAQTLL